MSTDAAPFRMNVALGRRLLALRRDRLQLPELAQRLGISEDDVLEAHRWMGVALNGYDEAPAPRPADASLEADLDKMPKRIQDRIRKTRGEQ